MTVEELGRRYKAKHPECELSDVEAGRMLKEKYPNDYWDVIDVEEVTETLVKLFTPAEQTSLDPFSSNFSNLSQIDYRQHHEDLARTTASLNEYYNPKQGRFKSWWRRGKVESGNKLLETIGAGKLELIRQGAMLEEAALTSERNKIEFQKFVATHTVELLELKSQAYRIEEAITKGVDSYTVNEINRARYLNETDVEYKARMYELDIEKERQMSKIKLEDYEGKKKADNEAKAEEYRIDQDNIGRVQREALELIDLDTKRIFKMYDDLADFKASDDPAKEDKIIRLQKNIKVAEDALDAKQARLVQNETGEKAGGFDTDADSFRSDRETGETDFQ